MKRIVLCILLLSLSAVGSRGADLTFGWGGAPLYFSSDLAGVTYGYSDMCICQPGIDNLYHASTGALYTTGVFSLEYTWYFKKWLGVSADFGAVGYFSGRAEGNSSHGPSGVALYLIPKIRFNYLVRDIVTLYSNVGLGLYAGVFDSQASHTPVFHMTPLGVTVGKKVFGFAQMDIGMRNIGYSAGVGIRF